MYAYLLNTAIIRMTSMIKPDILMYKTTATRNSTIIQHTATAAAFIYSSMLIAEVIKYYRVWLLPTPATETKYYRVRLLPARDPECLPTNVASKSKPTLHLPNQSENRLLFSIVPRFAENRTLQPDKRQLFLQPPENNARPAPLYTCYSKYSTLDLLSRFPL